MEGINKKSESVPTNASLIAVLLAESGEPVRHGDNN
jgi:hypothetical protein